MYLVAKTNLLQPTKKSSIASHAAPVNPGVNPNLSKNSKPFQLSSIPVTNFSSHTSPSNQNRNDHSQKTQPQTMDIDTGKISATIDGLTFSLKLTICCFTGRKPILETN